METKTPKKSSKTQPRLVIGIGDLHGHIPALEGILNRLDELYMIFKKDGKLKNNVRLVFCGDYIDRGKQSKELLERIKELEETNSNVEALAGNHELMALGALDQAKGILENEIGGFRQHYSLTVHGYNGGGKLLQNFIDLAGSGDSREGLKLMINYLEKDGPVGNWLRERPAGVIHEIKGRRVLFVHGGVPVYMRRKEDLEKFFRDWKQYMQTGTKDSGGSDEKYLRNKLVGGESVFWVRDMPKRDEDDVRAQLRGLGLDFVVFGHTPKQEIEMYHNVLFDIDVGMSEAYGERDPSAIAFKKNGVFAVYKSRDPVKLRDLDAR